MKYFASADIHGFYDEWIKLEKKQKQEIVLNPQIEEENQQTIDK